MPTLSPLPIRYCDKPAPSLDNPAPAFAGSEISSRPEPLSFSSPTHPSVLIFSTEGRAKTQHARTSKGVCPRDFSHCETAVRGRGVTKLLTRWHSQLNLDLPRVEVWDNTPMLTPRPHFTGVARWLSEIGKPADFVCGITPAGVEERELRWRINQRANVRLQLARLECNRVEDLARFQQLLTHTRECRKRPPPHSIATGTWTRSLQWSRLSLLRSLHTSPEQISPWMAE